MKLLLKYTLARIGLFLAVLLALWPVRMNILVKLMIAVLFSAALALLLLRRWRDEMAGKFVTAADRRRAVHDRPPSTLADSDPPDTDQSRRDPPDSADGPPTG